MVALAAFLVYAVCAETEVSFWDCGEFISAVSASGSPSSWSTTLSFGSTGLYDVCPIACMGAYDGILVFSMFKCPRYLVCISDNQKDSIKLD